MVPSVTGFFTFKAYLSSFTSHLSLIPLTGLMYLT